MSCLAKFPFSKIGLHLPGTWRWPCGFRAVILGRVGCQGDFNMGPFGFMNVQCIISGRLRLKYAWFLKHTTLLGYTMHRYAQCSSVFWISGLSPIFRIFFGTFTIRVVTLRYKTIDLSIFGYDRICRKEPVLERGIYWVLATTEKDRRQRQLGGWKLNLSSHSWWVWSSVQFWYVMDFPLRRID